MSPLPADFSFEKEGCVSRIHCIELFSKGEGGRIDVSNLPVSNRVNGRF